MFKVEPEPGWQMNVTVFESKDWERQVNNVQTLGDRPNYSEQ